MSKHLVSILFKEGPVQLRQYLTYSDDADRIESDILNGADFVEVTSFAVLMDPRKAGQPYEWVKQYRTTYFKTSNILALDMLRLSEQEYENEFSEEKTLIDAE